MIRSSHIAVRINLPRVRANAEAIRAEVGVPLIAVVKADAYGLGAEQVVGAIADIAKLLRFQRGRSAGGTYRGANRKNKSCHWPRSWRALEEFLAQRVRPAVWDVERTVALREARPVLSVDTGMQRFACSADQIDAVIEAGRCDEAFTHATSPDRVDRLLDRVGSKGLTLHAAGSSLLHIPAARLNAVRPGLALYQGAVHVSTPLIETHLTSGPAGYSRFQATRHGVILAGYSNGLRPGPCMINGRPSRVVEVGMQSAFVELTEANRPGDEVVLLGDGISESQVAAEWKTSPHEVLVRLCGAGHRTYTSPETCTA